MDFTTANTAIKTPDTDTEPLSPSNPKPIFNRSLSFTKVALKPHQPRIPPPQQPPTPTMVVAYKECLKNHAASLGGHALDGCGEFMPSPSFNPTDPTSLKCAACGCHRNFHRRDQKKPKNVISHRRRLLSPPTTTHHHQYSSSPSPSSSAGCPTLSPQSPPPVSHLPPSYFASPPQILLALSSGFSGPSDEQHHHGLNPTAGKIDRYPNEKKRSRTKFSQEQKEKMCLFAEKVGWRMQKSDERLVEEFCNEVGVCRGVLKVWIHNNKHSLKKRSERSGDGGEQMINSNINVKYEISKGDEGCGRVGFDSIIAQSTDCNEGSRASFHLSNNGSSSSS